VSGELLDAYCAISVSVFDEIHRCYPELLRAREPSEISDEALVAWRLLLGVEELFALIDAAQRRCVERPAYPVELLLPF
jgi:hypothetical protein